MVLLRAYIDIISEVLSVLLLTSLKFRPRLCMGVETVPIVVLRASI